MIPHRVMSLRRLLYRGQHIECIYFILALKEVGNLRHRTIVSSHVKNIPFYRAVSTAR
jgi:hypothetical protein